MAEIPLILIVCIIFVRAFFKVAAGQILACLVSSLSAAIYIVCLWIPAHLQESGLLVSKLELGQMLAFPNSTEISKLSLSWAAELTVVLLGEILANFLWRPNVSILPELRTLMSPVIGHVEGAEVRRVSWILLIVGFIAIVAVPASVENRAQGGQGFGTILRSFLVVGLSLLAYNKFFRQRAYYLIGGIGIVILIAGKVRNPLLVVLVGYIAGMISRRELRTRRAISLLFFAGVLAFLGSWMSTMRAAVTRHLPISPLYALQQTLENPFVSVYSAGIDTLDGYRFSMQILPFEKPHPENVVTIVTNFVPRALWPDKPTDISNVVSEKYLNYGASGMFLSPVGHLALVFGGYGFALAGMFFFGFVSTWLARVLQNSFVLAIVILVIIDYLLAGGFFCIYQGLAQLLPLMFSTILVRTVRVHRLQNVPARL